MQKETFKQGLTILCATFPKVEFNGKVYWELLKDLEDKDFIEAIKIICHTLQEIYPGSNTIAKIRDIALNDSKKVAGLAWAEILKEISRVGYVGKPKFSQDVITQAVEFIGWRNLCCSVNIGVERAHFLKVYPQLMDREKKDEVKKIGSNQEGTKKLTDLTKDIG